MLRFLFLFLISPVVFAYCPSIDLPSYPAGTPDTICIDYIGENCEAVCGGSPGSQVRVCVENSGKKGGYWLTGKSCTSGGSGNPASGATDTGGGGVVDCSANPGDPSCATVDCVNQPSNPACASDFSADISGYYHDNTGKVRTILLNSNFGGDISTATSKITDSIANLSLSVSNTNPAPLLSSIDLKLALLSTTNSLLQTIDNSVNHLNGKIGGIPSGPSSTSPDYSAKLDSLISGVSQVHNATFYLQPFLSGEFNGLKSMLYPLTDIKKLDREQRDLTAQQNEISRNILNMLYSVDVNLGAINSNTGSGSGSGGGEGEGSGPSVGTAENPAHIASSLYKPCANCIVDVDGAKAELDASKEKLKKLNKTIQAEFKKIFTFDSDSGSGSSAIASCWDFGSLIGEKCMQLDETWALLKALVVFIFMIAIIFMFMRGD